MAEQQGILYIVGIGPGAQAHTTPSALGAIADANVIVGYTTYIKLVRHLPPSGTVSRCALSENWYAKRCWFP